MFTSFLRRKKTLNTNPCVRFSPAVSQLSILKLSRRTAPGQRIQWTFHWRSALQRGPLGRWRWQRERWPPAERVRGQLVQRLLVDPLYLLCLTHCSSLLHIAPFSFPWQSSAIKCWRSDLFQPRSFRDIVFWDAHQVHLKKNIHDLPIEHIQNWWTLWFYYWHLLVKHVRRSDGYSAKPQKFCRK